MHATRMKPWRWLVLLSALALLLAACPAEDDDLVEEEPDVDEPVDDDADVDEPDEPDEPEGEPVEGGTIVWAYEQEPGVLNPTINDGNLYATSQIALATVLPLWVITPEFDYVPSPLLESGEPSDEDAEQFHVVYTLNEGANWSDGEPVRARDVVFTLEVCLDPDADITSRAGCDAVDMDRTMEEMEPDAKEVTVYFNEPYAPWQTLFATADQVILPSHAFGEESPGEDWNTTWADAIENPDTGEPIASGPFVFESWERGLQLEIVRNDEYVGEPAHLDRVVFRFVPDIDTMVQQLRGGEIDLIDPQPQLDLIEQIEAIDGVSMQVDAGPTWEHLDFQHTHPLLAERWMREAFARAIDRDAFIEQFILPMNPDAEPLNSIVYVSTQEEYEDHFGEHVDYDPERAREILEENCEEGGDGIFECNGERASFDWVTTAGNERRELFFEFAQQQLQEVGIEVNADFGEPAVVFSADVLVAGNWDLFNFAWVGSPDPLSNVELWGCFAGEDNRTEPGEEFGFQNTHRYCPDEEVSQALIDSNRAIDPAERAALMNEAGAALGEAIPILPLYQLPNMVVHNDDFAGLEINTTQWGTTWNVAEWRQSG
jgi:peptide/nickel transport system substrate-binding protein